MKLIPFLLLGGTLMAPGALSYPLGERDAGAAHDAPLNPTTAEATDPLLNLTLTGSGGTYSSAVPAGGSTLCAALDGSQYFTGGGAGFFTSVDQSNFTLSFDVKPTAVSSFHIAVALGRYGGGASFIYTTGTDWRYHIGGVGDQISGGSFTLGAWHRIELVRQSGATSLYVNGELVGSDPDFPTPSDDFSIGAAKKGDGTADGGFIGSIDNVRISGAEDTDGDGLPNQWETANSLNPNSASGVDGAAGDPDGDTHSNLDEFTAGSNPRNAASVPGDVDGDGLSDTWERTNFGNLAQTGTGDPDGDRATNEEEETAGTLPGDANSWPDTDADGLNDAWEVFYFRATPAETVSAILAKHAGSADPDNDGFDNLAEQEAGSNPALATSKPASTPNRNYPLGELDVGAANGSPLLAITSESEGRNLTRTGTGGTYSNAAAAGGSTLCAAFTGTQIYGDARTGFYTGLNQENFFVECDAFPTASTSFHIALTAGSNRSADGTGGNIFIYHAGGEWFVHSNGLGNIISGGAGSVQMNAWQKLRFERIAGEAKLYINGVQAGGATIQFPAGGLKSALSIAGNRNNSGAGFEGGFVGRIDNVKVQAIGGDADADGLLDEWETANGLSPASSAGNDGAAGDPDGDGDTNLKEFALGGNPQSAGSRGSATQQVVTIIGTSYAAVTFACRADAVFTGSAPATASRDGITYSVRGTADLQTFDLEVAEVIPAVTTGLPAAPVGYTWRTFRLSDSTGVRPRGFLQVKATAP